MCCCASAAPAVYVAHAYCSRHRGDLLSSADAVGSAAGTSSLLDGLQAARGGAGAAVICPHHQQCAQHGACRSLRSSIRSSTSSMGACCCQCNRELNAVLGRFATHIPCFKCQWQTGQQSSVAQATPELLKACLLAECARGQAVPCQAAAGAAQGAVGAAAPAPGQQPLGRREVRSPARLIEQIGGHEEVCAGYEVCDFTMLSPLLSKAQLVALVSSMCSPNEVIYLDGVHASGGACRVGGA
jgi:hypothetical protein